MHAVCVFRFGEFLHITTPMNYGTIDYFASAILMTPGIPKSRIFQPASKTDSRYTFFIQTLRIILVCF